MKKTKFKFSLAKPLMAAGVGTVVAAGAFVPATAEAHCGHGMWGYVFVHDYEPYYDSGCTGKGTPSGSFNYAYCWNEECSQYEYYYNCYTTC